jgi:hypothetical protein
MHRAQGRCLFLWTQSRQAVLSVQAVSLFSGAVQHIALFLMTLTRCTHNLFFMENQQMQKTLDQVIQGIDDLLAAVPLSASRRQQQMYRMRQPSSINMS